MEQRLVLWHWKFPDIKNPLTMRIKNDGLRPPKEVNTIGLGITKLCRMGEGIFCENFSMQMLFLIRGKGSDF